MAEALRRLLWGWPTLALILAAGAYFSYETCFFQVRKTACWLKAALGSRKQKGKGISQFQALTAALAGSIGTGNIVGVAAAVTVGGPGALFWMCASSLLGMMTVFMENYLCAHFKKAGGRGTGALRYIEKAGRWGGALALIYAAGCCLSSLGMGNMVQMHAFSAACRDLGAPPWALGLLAGGVLFFVAWGGLGFAVKITEKLVPAMTLLFMGCSLFVLWVFRENLPGALYSIWESAFSLRAGAGGTAGMVLAMQTGVSRGVFTNEAGLGSSAFAYEEVENRAPIQLGYMGIFQVFLDTLVMCMVTGLCILCCQGEGLSGAQLTFYPYQQAMGIWGRWAVSLCTVLFAFATAVAWCCYGRSGLFYLTGGRGRTAFAAASALAAVLGCLLPLDVLFQLGDAFNGLMAIPNIAALFLLAPRALGLLAGEEQPTRPSKKRGHI